MIGSDVQGEAVGTVEAPSSPVVAVSVVVPVRNEERYIRGTLEQIFAQERDGATYEILVVDGESTDATREIVRELQADRPNLKLLSNPRRLSSAARNIGVRNAAGEFVVVVDGHCDLDNPRYLKDLVEAFGRSEADCLGRPQPLNVAGASPFQRAVAAARSSWLGHHPASHIYSATEQFVQPQSVAVAYRRSVFDKVGLFDEAFDACEDVELNHRVHRAGMSCFFTPRLRAYYHPRTNLKALFRQMVRYGRGRVRLLRKHPDTFSVPSLVPSAFVLGLIAGPIAACLLPVLWIVYGAVLATYLVMVLLASMQIALEPGQIRLLPVLPLVFVTIHLGAGFGSLRELVAGNRGIGRK